MDVLRLSCERCGDDRRVRRKPSEGVEVSLRNPDCLEAVTVSELRALDEQIVLVSVEGCLVVAEEERLNRTALSGTCRVQPRARVPPPLWRAGRLAPASSHAAPRIRAPDAHHVRQVRGAAVRRPAGLIRDEAACSHLRGALNDKHGRCGPRPRPCALSRGSSCATPTRTRPS